MSNIGIYFLPCLFLLMNIMMIIFLIKVNEERASYGWMSSTIIILLWIRDLKQLTKQRMGYKNK